MPYRGRDHSLIQRHTTCLFKLIQFLGREFICPQFTNIKGFALGLTGVCVTRLIPTYDIFYIPSPIVSFCLATIHSISWLTLFLEGFGLFRRILFHYDMFFASDPRNNLRCSLPPSPCPATAAADVVVDDENEY